jgi:hypothetical protein
MNATPKGLDDYISELISDSGSGVEFLEQTYERAVSATTANIVDEKPAQAMLRLSIYLTSRLSKTKGVTALDYIDVFERLYGAGKPMAGVPFITSKISTANIHFLAAIFYVQHRGDFVMGRETSPEIQKVIAQLAFSHGKGWVALKPILDRIDDARPGTQLTESIADLLINLDRLFTTDHDVAVLQHSGGVERIKSVGASLEKISDALFKDFKHAKLGQKNVALVYAFLKESSSELLASGVIDKTQVEERYAKMITATMLAWSRQKGPVPAEYRSILTELIPRFSKKQGSEIIPRLTKLIPVSEIVQMFKAPREIIEDKLFKIMVKKYAGGDHGYDLVMAMGLDDLYTPLELNRLKGKKLEAALGL